MTMGKYKTIIISLLLLLFIGGIVFLSFAQRSLSKPLIHKKVLIIQSDESTCRDYLNSEKEIRELFKKQGIDASIHAEYLDCEHLLTHEEEKEMFKMLSTQQSWHPDIIITFNDQATYSLMSCKHPLAKSLPVIFAGVNYPNWNLLTNYPNIKGFWDKPDIMGTVRLIKDIHGPRCICFWMGESFLGRKAVYHALKTISKAGIKKLDYYDYELLPGEKYNITQSDNERNREFLENTSLNQKPPKEMEYSAFEIFPNSQERMFLKLSYPKTYKVVMQIARTYTTRSISLNTNVEGFTAINRGFGTGEGLVGGHITTIQKERQLAVQMATDVLKGKDILSLGYYMTPKEYVVDWKEMNRWNIAKKQIPEYCHIINYSLYDQYKTFILIVVVLIVILISYLVFQSLRKERKLRRHAQKNLKRNEKILSMSLLSGKIYSYESDGKMFYFDKSFYEVNGLPKEPVSLNTFRSWFHPTDREQFDQLRNQFWKVPTNLDTQIFQRRLSFHGEDYSWWEFRYSYSCEEEKFLGLCLNVNNVKQTEQLLIDAKHKAEESDRMKSTFLAEMSHEIRTPLNAIIGFSNLLVEQHKELTDEESEQYCSMINTHSELLLKLVNDILDLSRIESGRMTFKWVSCNLNELFQNIYNTEKQLISDRLELKLDIPESPVIAITDNMRFTQVIINLINNAAKFTEKGYIAFGYRIVDNGKTIETYVEDTGKGIPQEAQEAIFERFNKLDSFVQGAGLGLSICQGIIRLFEGTISLQSEIGKGSRFTILLPLITTIEEGYKQYTEFHL